MANGTVGTVNGVGDLPDGVSRPAQSHGSRRAPDGRPGAPDAPHPSEPSEPSDLARLVRERDYYRRQVDELAGVNLKLDYTLGGLRHEAKQKREGFALLSELQQSIGTHKSVSTIFEITMAAINATLAMDRTVVLTPAQQEHVYRPAQWLGFREDAAGKLAAAEVPFPPQFAAGTGLLIVNRTTAPTPLIRQLRAALDLPYFICLPVMGERAPIGLLLTGRLKEARPYYPPMDEGDADTLLATAGLISATVRNMRIAVLEETDRLKTEFFANVSHEFRTPLTLSLGPLQQLLGGRYGPLPSAAVEQLRVIERNQWRLLTLVNQVLDLVRLEAGRMQLRAAPMPDVDAFIADRGAQFRAAAEARGVALRLCLGAGAASADFFVDREKLDLLLSNLVSNALKFTPQGYVEVATAVREGALQLTVADSGIGIQEDQLPHIFDRFRQADGSVSREYAGSGLGLALVKEIATLHGGDVTVRSEYGRGSTFCVTLPLGRAHLSPACVVDIAEGAAFESAAEPLARLLVVPEGAAGQHGVEEANRRAESRFDPGKPTLIYAEDNADLRHHVRDLLADDYNVFLAADGREGLHQAGRRRPDLILADQMMPGMSGQDLLRAVRADADLYATPFIFLTARAGDEARIETLAAGADDYLSKPFHEAELLARVRNLLRARAQERQLVDLNRQLLAASRHKSEFLANMSHELRTPLNAIIGFTRLVLRRSRDVLPEQQADNLSKVLVSAEHLLTLINDVLDLSKIEAGRVEIRPATFDVAALLDFCLQTVAPAAQGQGLSLTKRVAPGLPPACTDEDRLKQILLNLLSNAVKFTAAGGVDVGAHVEGKKLVFAVADTGIGIPAEQMEAVFGEFRQADTGATRQYGGTGLGLAISRRLARLMGGDIAVASTRGVGSTFTLSIPLRYEP
jgi:signal transduction histidine kinase